MDKRLAPEKIRARLEKRLATFLGCELQELPRMKLGTLVHTAFLLWGHQLMREPTLDQMGKEISAAIQSLTLAQRKAIGETLLSALRKPVGTLGGKCMSEPKMGPTEFAAEVEKLKDQERFPSLETLLAVIAETRAEYREKILAARRGEKKRNHLRHSYSWSGHVNLMRRFECPKSCY